MDYKVILEKMIVGGFCFLSSINSNGYPQTRAMLAPMKVDNDKIYLHTNTGSNKVEQLTNDKRSCLYFYNGSLFEGLTLIGNVRILDDEEKQAYWKDEYEFYYPKGTSDFTILEFSIINGEYYNNLKTEEFRI